MIKSTPLYLFVTKGFYSKRRIELFYIIFNARVPKIGNPTLGVSQALVLLALVVVAVMQGH